MFNKLIKCLEKLGIYIEEVWEDKEQLSSSKEDRNKTTQAWEDFKKEAYRTKELGEQLNLIDELNKDLNEVSTISVEAMRVKDTKDRELREERKLQERLVPIEKPIENSERKVPKNLAKFPHYFAKIPNFTHLDIYMVSEMFKLNSYQHHAVKKLVAAGKRGSKDQVKDLLEVIATVEGWIDFIKSEEI